MNGPLAFSWASIGTPVKFDIILPTIARGSLFTAINSVCQQTYQDWNLWVVQDSTVASSMLVQAFPDPRIRWLKVQTTNDDYGAVARNFGIKHGDGDWIAYIDDDDEWLPHHLATIVNLHQLVPETEMIRTAGQSFKMGHKSPRSSKRVPKLGPVNSNDILTVGMAHTRLLFYETDGWLPVDNHDHVLWKQMKISAQARPIECETVTFLFER